MLKKVIWLLWNEESQIHRIHINKISLLIIIIFLKFEPRLTTPHELEHGEYKSVSQIDPMTFL